MYPTLTLTAVLVAPSAVILPDIDAPAQGFVIPEDWAPGDGQLAVNNGLIQYSLLKTARIRLLLEVRAAHSRRFQEEMKAWEAEDAEYERKRKEFERKRAHLLGIINTPVAPPPRPVERR